MSEEKIVTVKDLIIKLLEHNMLDEVIVKDKYGDRLHDVDICATPKNNTGQDNTRIRLQTLQTKKRIRRLNKTRKR